MRVVRFIVVGCIVTAAIKGATHLGAVPHTAWGIALSVLALFVMLGLLGCRATAKEQGLTLRAYLFADDAKDEASA